jgi:endonuclease YncB( thermonuclease family)
MQKSNIFLGVVAVLLAVALLCAFCLLSGLSVTALGLLPKSSQPVDSATSLPTLSGIRSTPPPTPTATRGRLRTPTAGVTTTAVLSSTQVQETGWITSTLAAEPFTTLTTTITLTATQYPLELTSTPAPALSSWCLPVNADYQEARVAKVMDGVSFEGVVNGETIIVRLIGIDLPDPVTGSPAWLSAQAYLRTLVEGKSILLTRDLVSSDSQGNMLRYAIAGGIFINRQMVEDGYAIARSGPPNVSCDLVFAQAEALARLAGWGVWGATPTPTRTALPPTATVATTGELKIAKIQADGMGWQDPDEYVEIRNAGSWPVQLSGWTLSDLEGHTFIFSRFILKPGQYCRIYTNEFHPDTCGFSYFSPAPIWENDVDCALLKDPQGNLVDQVCYD